jgi:O-methyltransferase
MSIYNQVRDRTMVCESGVAFTAAEAVRVVREDVPGVLVECGTWRGGCALAMLLAQREVFGAVRRPVHLMDSFAGLPPADYRDGPAALAWQAANPDNCRASARDAMSGLIEAGFAHQLDFFLWGGLFSETLPQVARKVRDIALLRIDCDWYASVRPCLAFLTPKVPPRGTVIIDDYFAWDGCARAVHQHLSDTMSAARLRSLPDFSSAYWYQEKLA